MPSVDGSKKNTVNLELNKMKDFIIESADLKDKLIAVLDDANCLPINFLTELLFHAKDHSTTGQAFQLILTGPGDFKDQLLALDKLGDSDLTHFPMDDLNENKILNFAKNKIYKISSNINHLKFKSGSLHLLSDFSQTDKQILDVILEWCAALTKKDQLTSITTDTVYRAISFAQQFSKDKNIRLASAYPPSHEVYKYINDIETTKNSATNKPTSIDRHDAREAFIKSPNKTDSQETKIPTITSRIASGKKTLKPNRKDNLSGIKEENAITLDTYPVIEDEIMPARWTPSPHHSSTRKKPFPALAGLLTTLVLGFIIFIAYKITEDSTTEDIQNVQVIAQESDDVAVTEVQSAIASSDAVIEEQDSVSEKDELVVTETQNEIAITSIKKNTTETAVIHTPKVAPLVLGELDESILSENTIDLSKNTSIAKLLTLAKKQFQNKRLSTPAGDNALETYQKILEMQPDNQQAIVGIKEVHDKYLNWANYYLKHNDVERAKRFYNRALIIDPNDKVAQTSLENIKNQQTASSGLDKSAANSNPAQDIALPSNEFQNSLLSADKKLLQIQQDITLNQRNYKVFQDVQTIYQNVLNSQPDNLRAKQGLSTLKEHFVDWAEIQIQNRNYNIALFLYGQALSIEPDNFQLSQRIEEIREFKNSL